MDLLSKKKEIYGAVAADKTLVEGLPKLRTTSSTPSINNDGNTIGFLSDLLKTLVGSESLQEILIDTLIYSINDIEREIKLELKRELKSIVSCGVNPSIPNYLRTNGIKFTVKNFDYFGLMYINPKTEIGQLIFNDITPNLIDSSDFNTFLYQTIQKENSNQIWPQYAGATKPILNIKFKSVDVAQIDPNNTITVKVDPSFNGTLTNLNNQFIDSVKLFNTEKIVSQLVDLVFGTISSNTNKSIKQLELEEKINTIIKKIINTDSNTIIDDNVFSFTNDENKQNEFNAKMRKKGDKFFNTEESVTSKIELSTLTEMNTNIGNNNSEVIKKEELTKSIKLMGDNVTENVKNNKDKKSVSLGFIKELLEFLIQAIVVGILSPKIITIFLINFKIIYGQNATFDNPIDFLKKNKNLIRAVSKKVAGIIINALLRAVLKQLTELVVKALRKKLEDKAKLKVKQLLSLIGVPPEVLLKMKNI